MRKLLSSCILFCFAGLAFGQALPLPPININPPVLATPRPKPADQTKAAPQMQFVDSASAPAVTPLPKPVADTANDENSPISHPPVHSASFLGVTTGITTEAELLQKLGTPKKSTQNDVSSAHLFSIDGFNHIEVTLKKGIVDSISISLDEPMPVSQVRDALAAELQKAKPITIADDSGDVLGQVFPEKGINLIYTPSEKNGVPSSFVARIAIEPITAEPFVLRAEGYFHDLPEESKHDLQNALIIDPKNSKANALLAQIFVKEGNTEDAIAACERAIMFDENQPIYHVTMAQIMALRNQTDKAKLYLQELIPALETYPYPKALALCTLADLYQSSSSPNFDKAIQLHQEAITVILPVTTNANPTLRLKAKDVLLNAHLGAAKDVAWGNWENRQAAALKWLSRAKEIAADPELTVRKPGTKDYALRIAIAELALHSGMPETTNIEPLIELVLQESQAIVNGTSDATQKMKLQWDTALALNSAAHIYQARKQFQLAQKYAEMSVSFAQDAVQKRTSNPQDVYWVARIYFRLGAIHALGSKNHKDAIVWYDRARPLLEQVCAQISPEEFGKLGEYFITMGVSYWDSNNNLAIELSLYGAKLVEKGVEAKFLDSSALIIPYRNISTMYKRLGKNEESDKFAAKAQEIRIASQQDSKRL